MISFAALSDQRHCLSSCLTPKEQLHTITPKFTGKAISQLDTGEIALSVLL